MVQIRKLDKIAQEIKSLDIDDLNYLFDALEKDKKNKNIYRSRQAKPRRS